MSIMTAVVAEAAADGAEHSSQISPFAFGGFALAVLLLLLWLTTRINIDR